MSEFLLQGLILILVLGVLAQWIAWRLHLPSILLLLVSGLLAGPVLGILSPDQILGELLFPVVSLSVAIILFEGGLTLRYRDFQTVGWVVTRLVILGGLLTGLLSTLAAHLILGLSWGVAALFGSVLVVTGPTVVIPLLHQIRPRGRIGPIARWEGIMNDPIGAILAVLVFELLLSVEPRAESWQTFQGFFLAVGGGTLLGMAGGFLLLFLLRRYWIPDRLHSPVALMLVLTVFSLANHVQAESGLLSVTLMGMILANQRKVSIKHIIQFKENLQVLLIAILFIILAARIQPEQLELLSTSSFLFLAVLILLIRPVAVWVATLKTGLNWREKAFLFTMAPRGIVAAAVISVFALQLSGRGYPEAEKLIPLVFLVIAGTVAVYGLSAMPVARWLGLASPSPQGVLFAGASDWIVHMASQLQKLGFRTVLVDNNLHHVMQARLAGLETHHENILSEAIFDEIDLGGIGRLMAMTPNDEVNALACLHFMDWFGRQEIYQLAPEEDETLQEEEVPIHLRGRVLFREDATWSRLNLLFHQGARIKATPITEEFSFQDYQNFYSDEYLPLFIVREQSRLIVLAVDQPEEPEVGDTLVSLVWKSEAD